MRYGHFRRGFIPYDQLHKNEKRTNCEQCRQSTYWKHDSLLGKYHQAMETIKKDQFQISWVNVFVFVSLAPPPHHCAQFGLCAATWSHLLIQLLQIYHILENFKNFFTPIMHPKKQKGTCCVRQMQSFPMQSSRIVIFRLIFNFSLTHTFSKTSLFFVFV